jgi:hypothetical protein
MQVQCAACKETMTMEDPRAPQIMNSAATSVVMVEHPEQRVCPGCGRTVAAFVTGVNLMVTAVPIQVQAQKRIVLAGN